MSKNKNELLIDAYLLMTQIAGIEEYRIDNNFNDITDYDWSFVHDRAYYLAEKMEEFGIKKPE